MNKTTVTNLIIILSLALAIFAAPVSPMIAVTGASGNVAAGNVSDLRSFVDQVATSDNAKVVAGVYAEDLMSAPVVQQPASNPGYVSEKSGVVTQFGMTAQFGNVALLAHNFLQGAAFFNLNVDSNLTLVYGDGTTQKYAVTEVLRYQALSPLDPYTDFVDLNSGNNERITVETLFNDVYTRSDVLILQTCIENNGNDSWGRLFVIAEPVTQTLGEKLAVQTLSYIQ